MREGGRATRLPHAACRVCLVDARGGSGAGRGEESEESERAALTDRVVCQQNVNDIAMVELGSHVQGSHACHVAAVPRLEGAPSKAEGRGNTALLALSAHCQTPLRKQLGPRARFQKHGREGYSSEGGVFKRAGNGLCRVGAGVVFGRGAWCLGGMRAILVAGDVGVEAALQ